MDSILLLEKIIEMGIHVKITIVGDIKDLLYYQSILKLIKRKRIDECIKFLPFKSQNKLVELYKSHDICFFPAIKIWYV